MNNFTKLSDTELINIVVINYLNSEQFKTAFKAREYYKNKNDIIYKERYAIVNGIKQKAEGVENNIIAHPVFRELVDQKINYLLSNDWNVEDETLAEIFNDNFRIVIEKASADAIMCGIGWFFASSDNTFQYVDALGIIPIWRDVAHTQLEKVVRIYSELEYTSVGIEEVKYAELWDSEGVKIFKQSASGAYMEKGYKPHLQQKIIAVSGSLEEKGYAWGKVPFIYIKYNNDEISLLTLVKSLIDKMDDTASRTQDLLSDITNKVTVLSNATATDLAELAMNRQLYRAVSLPEGATYEEVGTEPNITAAKDWIEHLRSQIYIAGRGYDPLQAIGANASGDARRNLYTSLDLDVNQLESGVLEAFRSCIWFINNSPNNKFTVPENTKIKFMRNIMVNQGELIENASKLQGIDGLTKKTIVSMTGVVEDVDREIREAEKEKEEDAKKQADIFNIQNNQPFIKDEEEKEEV